MNKLLVCVLLFIIIAGCSNSVSYHHSERNSIALEFKTTEPQQPLQGNIGVKTRTVLVTPGLRSTTSEKQSEKKPGQTSEQMNQKEMIL